MAVRVAEGIAAGELHHDVVVQARDETGRLLQAMQSMREQLRKCANFELDFDSVLGLLVPSSNVAWRAHTHAHAPLQLDPFRDAELPPEVKIQLCKRKSLK